MHVGGHGDAIEMATAIRNALAESKTPLEVSPAAASAPAVDLDVKQLDEIVGAKGRQNGGVYQFSVPRREAISDDGMAIAPPGPMGVATGINFQPTAAARRRSPAISCSRAMRSIR
jgi:Domain of Unknown Function (DUF1259)